MFVRGFGFLFYLFKLFYLAPLYKEFRTQAGLYTQSPPPRIGMWHSLYHTEWEGQYTVTAFLLNLVVF